MARLNNALWVGLAAALLALAGCPKEEAAGPPERGAPATAPAIAPTAVEVPPLVADQKTCPVMGGQIDKSVFRDYQGKRIYFCCSACLVKFDQDPDKYVAVVLQEAGAAPEAAAATQPTQSG